MEPISIEPIFNFQGSTILSVLVLMGTASVLGGLGVAFLILLARGNGFGARHVARAGAGVAGAGLAVVAGSSLVSRAGQAEPGSSRAGDCHPVYSGAAASARLPIGREDGLLHRPIPSHLPESSLAGKAEVGR